MKRRNIYVSKKALLWANTLSDWLAMAPKWVDPGPPMTAPLPSHVKSIVKGLIYFN
jgi:hypothetical protein